MQTKTSFASRPRVQRQTCGNQRFLSAPRRRQHSETTTPGSADLCGRSSSELARQYDVSVYSSSPCSVNLLHESEVTSSFRFDQTTLLRSAPRCPTHGCHQTRYCLGQASSNSKSRHRLTRTESQGMRTRPAPSASACSSRRTGRPTVCRSVFGTWTMNDL